MQSLLKHVSTFQLLCFIALAMTLLVSSRLLWSVSPEYRYAESSAVGPTDVVPLEKLCAPSPLAGLEGDVQNAATQKSGSLVYVIPAKFLKPYIDLYSLYRILDVCLYAGALMLLIGIAQKLALSFPFALLLLIHYGLSIQLLSYLYEAKLTLTSVVWLAWVLLLLILLEQSVKERKGSWSSYCYLLLMPISCVLSYETFNVSRPLAVVYWVVVAAWICCSRLFITVRARYIFCFFLSSLFSYLLIKCLHPTIAFDLSLFRGKGESIVYGSLHFIPEWRGFMWERLKELPNVVLLFPTNFFSSESPYDVGWLDTLLALSAISIVHLAYVFRKNQTASNLLATHRTYLFFLFILVVTSLIIPLCSTTPVRGHRLFGLYLTSTLILVILLNIAAKAGNQTIRLGLYTAAIIGAAVTLCIRVPLIYKWRPDSSFHPQYGAELVETLKNTPTPPWVAAFAYPVIIQVCDQKTDPDWEHFWNSALYVSDLGCRLNGERILLGCPCETTPSQDPPISMICLTRTIKDGKNEIVVSK